MASDRRWFAKHPTRLVRIRPAIDGEFLLDSVAGLYGQRTGIALGDASPGSPPHVAVVSIDRLIGPPCTDGGVRARYPVGHHPRSRRRDIEKAALAVAEAAFEALRSQHHQGVA